MFYQSPLSVTGESTYLHSARVCHQTGPSSLSVDETPRKPADNLCDIISHFFMVLSKYTSVTDESTYLHSARVCHLTLHGSLSEDETPQKPAYNLCDIISHFYIVFIKAHLVSPRRVRTYTQFECVIELDTAVCP